MKPPELVDVNALVDNLRSATRIYSLKGIARAAGLKPETLTHLRANNDSKDHRWSSIAPLVNLHLRVCPDEPIPEKRGP